MATERSNRHSQQSISPLPSLRKTSSTNNPYNNNNDASNNPKHNNSTNLSNSDLLSAVANSPTLSTKHSNTANKTSTAGNIRKVFSVDDDLNEVENDVKYLEGLQDGLKLAKQRLKKNGVLPRNKQQDGSNNTSVYHQDYMDIGKNNRNLSSTTTDRRNEDLITNRCEETNKANDNPEESGNLDENDNLGNNDTDARQLREFNPDDFLYKNHAGIVQHDPNDQLESYESLNPIYSASNHTHSNSNHNKDTNDSQADHEDYSDDNEDAESFTLRERQNAINETHPFGIRIWKPALYKKSRSIQKAADQDIHETRYKDIPLLIKINNVLYSIILGLPLMLLSFSLAFVIFTLTGFGLSKAGVEYARVFFKVGLYLFWPFGILMYMLKDENYYDEDRFEGVTVSEFYRWITSYKLFSNDGAQGSGEGEQSANAIDRNTTDPQGNPSISKNNISSSSFLLHTTPSNYGSVPTTSDRPTGQLKRYGSLLNAPRLSKVRNAEGNVVGGKQKRGDRPNGGHATDECSSSSFEQRRYFGRGKWTFARVIFYVLYYLVFTPILGVLSLITWLGVFTIPMSNVMVTLLSHLRKHPLALDYKSIRGYRNKSLENNILLCTFRCSGFHYYKYTVDGTNVIVMNLCFIVLVTIFDFYFLTGMYPNNFFTQGTTIFGFCLISTIPLAFYIGQAVASISAQTSMGLGAVINAFFSTIVEIFLYCVSLQQRKGLIVEGALIGSILGAVLLLPGFSMCAGAVKRKTQRYNPRSAGVSSAMLIFSMMVMFIPTMFYLIYGDYKIKCVDLVTNGKENKDQRCHFEQEELTFDKLYTKVIKPISISCAIILFVVYFIGLLFTLRTHAALIWSLPISSDKQNGGASSNTNGSGSNNVASDLEQSIHSTTTGEDANHGAPAVANNNNTNVVTNSSGHEAPNWSRSKSTIILLVATLAYAVIADILVDCVDEVLKDNPSINPKFLGLTIFALVPNTTEFLNAMSFAMNGNVALSMEIGTAYALQVCLLQIPSLVIFSMYRLRNISHNLIRIREQMFTLVFPRWDLIACMVSTFLFTYLYAEGKSNYFKGSLLILFYVILVVGFFFQGEIDKETFWNNE
ncbi:related to Low affinity vacuolar monovalent cation/H(+) antiporter [Saccharomycodes ludwigii]|uniref:Related to Low affinity vacuolar monovalent cation/H(+) antiporter n=1 Tax=Saccharomycodes ludwigii TaxID=36035 RepID=A0A376B3J2_9ASCO|nr:related to Low affinity vacuolar monovalent cation/H(+) antiporter [Saccharomycodes ludwigii]